MTPPQYRRTGLDVSIADGAHACHLASANDIALFAFEVGGEVIGYAFDNSRTYTLLNPLGAMIGSAPTIRGAFARLALTRLDEVRVRVRQLNERVFETLDRDDRVELEIRAQRETIFADELRRAVADNDALNTAERGGLTSVGDPPPDVID